MKRLVILVSDTGQGTNLQAIIDAISAKKLLADVAAVISDTTHSPALQIAQKHELPIKFCLNKHDLLPKLIGLSPDYIVLAGWKQLITDDALDTFPNQILNLHPGLIPETKNGILKNPDGTDGLWNKGMLSTVAIKNVLTNKATYGGSSIHFLTHEFDFGPVLKRCFEKTQPSDTIESFYTRLKKKENLMYIEVLEKLCNN